MRNRGHFLQLYNIHSIDNSDYNYFLNYSHVNFTGGDKFKIFRKKLFFGHLEK